MLGTTERGPDGFYAARMLSVSSFLSSASHRSVSGTAAQGHAREHRPVSDSQMSTLTGSTVAAVYGTKALEVDSDAASLMGRDAADAGSPPSTAPLHSTPKAKWNARWWDASEASSLTDVPSSGESDDGHGGLRKWSRQ